MTDLQGRVALVTGASRGIGAAAARGLAAAGARVIVTDVIDAAELASDLGGLFRRHDVSNEQEWIDTVAWAQAEAGGIDILVNNAGLFFSGSLAETSLEDWRRVHGVNVEGVFLGCKHAVPALAERAGRWKGGASIINLSSVAGLVGFARSSCYGASKGAVRLMTKCVALEVAPLKIRVNSVHPGVINTAMGEEVVSAVSASAGVGDNEARAAVDQMHVMGHWGEVANIADAVVFLASDKAAFMTGSEMVVDGGLTAG
jgi:NAD(P)-dependent dehydrogenase (short-subunit alcohol dehydrogenase family)